MHTKDLDEYKRSLLKHVCRYDFVSIGPLLAIFPIMIRKTLRKYYDVYSEICMEGSMIQGLLAINWFRLDLKEGEQMPNVKICC